VLPSPPIHISDPPPDVLSSSTPAIHHPRPKRLPERLTMGIVPLATPLEGYSCAVEPSGYRASTRKV
jgi:hypothetical protein